MRILFLCTGNSCRSIMAEAILRHMAPNIESISAGSEPAGYVHPQAIAMLKANGISTEGAKSTSWDALPAAPDIVITLCASAAKETCPVYLGPVVRSHWGMPDPAAVEGSEAQIQEAFAMTFTVLQQRIEKLIPLIASGKPATALQEQLDNIAAS